MKLATANVSGRPALHAGVGDSLWNVPVAAADRGISGLAFSDVGELLRAGDPALAAVAALVLALKKSEAPALRLNDLDLAAPVLRPGAIVCVGRNYAEHMAEGKVSMPPWPLLFSKFTNALVGHGARVRHPAITSKLDYEGELAIVIGRRAERIERAHALSVIAGYTIINDISARDLQEKDLQWIRGKSLDGFAPMGPVVVTVDEIHDFSRLRIQTRVNDDLRQDDTVASMHFDIPTLLAFITEGITLEPGDLVATGTPAGVGLGFDPPKWLKAGDRIDVNIDPIGTLRTEIVA